MDPVTEALVQQLALAIPVLFVAAVPLVLAWMKRLTARISDAVDEVEREKVANPARYNTPVSMRQAAVRKVLATTNGAMMSLVPTSKLEARIDATVAKKKADSLRPPPMSEKGEA